MFEETWRRALVARRYDKVIEERRDSLILNRWHRRITDGRRVRTKSHVGWKLSATSFRLCLGMERAVE